MIGDGILPGQRITAIEPLPPLDISHWGEEDFSPSEPIRTIEFEPRVEAIRTIDGAAAYFRYWEMRNPENLSPHITPEDINNMYKEVVRHAETSGMPSTWTTENIEARRAGISGTATWQDFELYDRLARANLGSRMATEIDRQVIEHRNRNVSPSWFEQGMGHMANNRGTWTSWNASSSTSTSHEYRVSYDTSTTGSNDGTWADWMRIGAYAGHVREETIEERQRHGARVAEQAQQAQERRDRWQEAQRERDAAKMEAEKKAEQLMLSLLNKDQKREYTEHSQITVPISKTSEIIIVKGRTGNLTERNPQTGSQKRWCVHVKDAVP
ncbi:MAG: flagellar export protein FliJ, partial [Planctomycetota bacterium]